jgi:hypothetical protein
MPRARSILPLRPSEESDPLRAMSILSGQHADQFPRLSPPHIIGHPVKVFSSFGEAAGKWGPCEILLIQEVYGWYPSSCHFANSAS